LFICGQTDPKKAIVTCLVSKNIKAVEGLGTI
jgi:hypothetical protein